MDALNNAGQLSQLIINHDGDLYRIAIRDGAFVIDKLQDDVWQPGSLKMAAETIFMGSDMAISAAGGRIVVKDMTSGVKGLVPHVTFGDDGTSEPTVPHLGAKIDAVVNADESSEITTKSIGFVVSGSDTILTRTMVYKTGSVAAGAAIVIEMYDGSDDTGTLYYKTVVPAADWTANSTVTVQTDAVAEIEGDANAYIKLTSTEDFSIKTNAAQDTPYFGSSLWAITENRLPYAESWSEKYWAVNEPCIEDGKVYFCTEAGAQTGTFGSNSDKWRAWVAKLIKDANTDINESQLVVQGDSNFGAQTFAALLFKSNASNFGSGESGRIVSYYDGSGSYDDATMVFQTIGGGGVFEDTIILADGKVRMPEVYGHTTQNSANVHIDSNGRLWRVE